jgi:hypothetical protein
MRGFEHFLERPAYIHLRAAVTPTPSIIDRLAATIPGIRAEWKEYREEDPAGRDDPLTCQARELGYHICNLMRAGRTNELQSFFVALEETYKGALSDADSVAMYEGFMEDLIMSVHNYSISPLEMYRQLGPESQATWEELWTYVRDTPWNEVRSAYEETA